MTQADTNTTQTVGAAQPMQQEELSALEKARMADSRQIIELDAEKAYDELELFGSEPGMYRDDSPVQGEYWRFKFRGSIVTVSPEFKKAYDTGSMLSVTAVPTVFERTVPDPNNAGMTKQAIAYGWSLSFSDLEKKKKAQLAKQSVRELQLTNQLQELKMQKKLEAVKSADLSKLVIKDEELQEMLDAL